MRPLLPAILVAFLVVDVAGAAPVRSLSDFDVGKVQGVADQLALCDLTAFLNTGPNLNADVIIGPNRGSASARVMRRPYYRPLTGLLDEDLDDALRALESRREVTRREVAKARTRYDVEMLASYERSGLPERAFLTDQARRCSEMFSPRR